MSAIRAGSSAITGVDMSDTKQTSAASKAIGLGIAAFLIGLIFIGASFLAGEDAENPRCDGQLMSKGDVCYSSRSTNGYESRADSARTASTWLLRLGGIAAVGGVVLVVGGAATRSD
ncbi:hypothetical protein [Nocardia sp. NPDC060259]|uniref:hypothetical protein n=1 Tax=Nocardia sp. NPDC060259 TaxID=3347088 RepID=UPI0036575D92